MQFELCTAGHAPDLAAIEHAIVTLDPAALVDLDATGQTLRISAAVTEPELLDCLRAADVSAESHQLRPLPSQCCGGCGG
ncbi:hypothetical protein [Lysobacter sp. Root667]|uniref:hypothetical protein n=1 Tax=Lysobacter sp. Root667 TaxID=1736581 RepID=UPI000AAD252B|nr:hypothetical protein [Lysobacter sp. Root667]